MHIRQRESHTAHAIYKLSVFVVALCLLLELRYSALALYFSLGRTADEKHMNTSLYLPRARLVFRVCVLQLPLILYS